MVDEAIKQAVRRFLIAVRQNGIQAESAVVFGSRAHGTARADSDIDVVVIAPEFDQKPSRRLIERMWELRAITDRRIEPVACGRAEWAALVTGRAIIEIARREGIEIAA
jgi:predicted nucleotidyltransferase